MPSLARIEAMLEALIVACIHDRPQLADLARSLADIERSGYVKCKKCQLEAINGKLDTLLSLYHLLETKVNQIMATQAELAASLNKLSDQLTKIGGETTQLIADVAALKAQLANAPVSAELQAAFDKVAAQAQKVDDMVPDQPTP
jgi:chromosome segregation ATPase